jgi:hypothetical protein
MSEGARNAFRVGERVVLFSCSDIPGTVIGFVRGRVQIRFDDFENEEPRMFRPESLRLAKGQAPLV